MSDSIDQHIARRVRGKRIALGLTQAALAKVVGIATELIEDYELAVSPIPDDHLQQLSQGLGVPLSYFLPSASCSRV